jgi:hypothetical protein
MKSVPHPTRNSFTACFILSFLLSLSPALSLAGRAQSLTADEATAPLPQTPPEVFRFERLPVAGGAELVTIFGKLNGTESDDPSDSEVPLVSVLRDTLGDSDPENDRLRYVWMLTHTRPSLLQRSAAAIPFLYNRVGNNPGRGQRVPSPILDLAATDQGVWNGIFWMAIQNLLLDPQGPIVKASTRTYRRNTSDYHKAHIMRALAVLSVYEAQSGARPAFTETEAREIQARLGLTEKMLGGIVDDIYLQRVYQKQLSSTRDVRGHNWELLRQRAEAEGLYFEPLELPDGSATHALLWVARQDLETSAKRRFNARFLNISSPWNDTKLRNWKGYTETRYFDADNRQVEAGADGTRAVELIPLALYGLDHPKIPILLVDFRDSFNPKRREASRRLIEDIARNILLLSRFGDPYYFLGRAVYDFVTGRRGADINQPSRFRAYSQLKLLLSLNESLAPQLRDEISRRVERVSLNPLENDRDTELRLARAQYAALVDYARRPDGLPRQLERDRRTEMTPLVHGRADQILFRIANIASLGLYTHREKQTPQILDRLALERKIDYHTRFLREVARTDALIEVSWNIDEVRRSLRFLTENGATVDEKMPRLAARIFAQTNDDITRQLCLDCLRRSASTVARNELLRIHNDPALDARWRTLSAEYLRQTRPAERPGPAEDTKAIITAVGQ